MGPQTLVILIAGYSLFFVQQSGSRCRWKKSTKITAVATRHTLNTPKSPKGKLRGNQEKVPVLNSRRLDTRYATVPSCHTDSVCFMGQAATVPDPWHWRTDCPCYQRVAKPSGCVVSSEHFLLLLVFCVFFTFLVLFFFFTLNIGFLHSSGVPSSSFEWETKAWKGSWAPHTTW